MSEQQDDTKAAFFMILNNLIVFGMIMTAWYFTHSKWSFIIAMLFLTVNSDKKDSK